MQSYTCLLSINDREGAREMNLFTKIEACPRVNRCWGRRSPVAYGPTVIPCRKQQPKAMIITEQPNLRRESASRPWNPSKLIADYLRDIKQGRTRGIANRIDDMFEGALLADFDEGTGSFDEFYWTHFIKCPGNIRRKREFGTGPLNANACADKWLLEEISRLKPRLIVSYGAPASSWMLLKTGYKGSWTDRIWEEFKWIITEQRLPDASFGGVTSRLIVALHPSGANPLAIPFNEKIGTLVKDSFNEL